MVGRSLFEPELRGPCQLGRARHAPVSELLCPARAGSRRRPRARRQDSYLVDSASSHMLVSKIKPCMSKYKQFIP